MISKRHFLFNIGIIVVPWLTLLFVGKRNMKRYSVAGIFIVVFEIVNHIYGYKHQFWKFFDKKRSFLKDELPFSLGPYMPLSIWLLKYSHGNFKKFLLLNVLADGIFAFVIMDILAKFKIIKLKKLNKLQFFFYIHYKAYLLYGIQSLYERFRKEA
ncbi:hypothetical protein [Ornithinibacillus halotolerans]|uniref:Uncharacterized protein n=1 Tax=Ornithinibacillus halotolerans TaxID=1274357 RepID=A0A916W779_9BACI|nr:hypothetical protein [Ornithinibacillus halotolerans]GGA72387.1 hypothetical protein GCM10008025_15220 [Ornithinibacillus halotolerans]